MGAEVGELCVGGDAVFCVDRDADVLVVEDGWHVAEVAVFAFIFDVGDFGSVGGRGDGDSCFFAGREDVAELLVDHGFGEVADSTA